MKKIIFKLFTLVIVISCLQINVFAATNADSTQSNFEELKSKYNQGLQKITLSSSETYSSANVTLYGKAVCTGSSCTNTYAASNDDSLKNALNKSVTCSTGEKYIVYQLAASGKDRFDKTKNSSLNYTGDGYWSEDYQVVCTNESKGTYIELTDNGNGSGSTTTTTPSTNSNYNSSSTVNQEQTGVTAYFIVLGLVALISGIFMMCVKKYNLFKNI